MRGRHGKKLTKRGQSEPRTQIEGSDSLIVVLRLEESWAQGRMFGVSAHDRTGYQH
jgi:hypothetical protein